MCPEVGDLDRVKDKPVTMTSLTLIKKGTIALRNNRIDDGVDVWRREA